MSILLPLLIGLVTGWLLNYLADVLPATLRLGAPTCLKCGQKQPPADYLSLRGCRSCGAHQRLRTYILPVLTTVSAAWLWLQPPLELGFWLGYPLLAYLGLVALIDLEERLVLRTLSILGLALGIGLGFFLHGWQATLIGGLAGFGIMFAFYMLGKLFSRLRARRLGQAGDDGEEALGSGDVTLATILGLLLGWPVIWFGLLMGILLAGIVSLSMIVFMLVTGRYKKQVLLVFIAYGPYFILSTITLLYFPTWIEALL
ncbi:MAG: hypothetical protein FJZ96_11100 [Chloroflexi bacterium]|nr:hypothetical protein [Chloroflexota bacterium]